jgi:hypothetical protein
MRLGVVIVMLALLIPSASSAESVTIRQDNGGDLGFYEVRLGVYEALGIKVRIDGVCASACTILTRLPSHQICATERAELRFHKIRPARADSIPADVLRTENARLLTLYPSGIRNWIATHGGLTDAILAMPSHAVAHNIGRCLPDDGSTVAVQRP